MTLYDGMAGQGHNAAVVCDLRSDTVTRPDAAMRRAMAEAEVGDDVYGDDPTVNRLEAVMAERTGKEAGLFCTSGTQSNLAALLSHCGRGEEVLVGADYHILCDEAAGASVLGGIALTRLDTDAGHAVPAAHVHAEIRPDDPHYPISRLLCLENTVGGRAIPLADIAAPAKAARDAGLSVHLDGARFFNAVTALGCNATDLAGLADSVSICLSKGLGAPIGTVLTGPRDLIRRARRNRKLLGGAMRQVGVIAAAGLHALDHNVAGLAADHDRAAHFGAALDRMGAGTVEVATNMVFLTPPPGQAAALRLHMAENGILIGRQDPTIRMVLHRDVTDAALDQTIAAFDRFDAAA